MVPYLKLQNLIVRDKKSQFIHIESLLKIRISHKIRIPPKTGHWFQFDQDIIYLYTIHMRIFLECLNVSLL